MSALLTEAYWLNHWNSVLNTLYIFEVEGSIKRPKVTNEQFGLLEKHLNFQLPLSYKAFIKVFGPGELMISFLIMAPGYEHADRVDIVWGNKWQEVEAEYRAEPERIKRLITFATFGDHNIIAWDPALPTDSTNGEFAIVMALENVDKPIMSLARSFREFIESTCIDGQIWKLLGKRVNRRWVDLDEKVRTDPRFSPLGGGPQDS